MEKENNKPTNSKKRKKNPSKKVLATSVAVATIFNPLVQPVTSIYAETEKDSGTVEENKPNNTKPDTSEKPKEDIKPKEDLTPKEPETKPIPKPSDVSGTEQPVPPTGTEAEKPVEEVSKFPKWVDEGYSDWSDEEKQILADNFNQDLSFKSASITGVFGQLMVNYGGYEFKLKNEYALQFDEGKDKLRDLVLLMSVNGYNQPINFYTNSKILENAPSLQVKTDVANFKSYYNVTVSDVKYLNQSVVNKVDFKFVTSFEDLKSRLGVKDYYFVYNTIAGKVNGEVVQDMSKFEPTYSKDGVTHLDMELHFLNLVPIEYGKDTNIKVSVEPTDATIKKDLTPFYDTSKLTLTDTPISISLNDMGENGALKSLKVNDRLVGFHEIEDFKLDNQWLEGGTNKSLKIEGETLSLASKDSTFSSKGIDIKNKTTIQKENWIKDNHIELGYQGKKALSNLQVYLNGEELESFLFGSKSGVNGIDLNLNLEDERIKSKLIAGGNTITVMDGTKQQDISFRFDTESPVNNGSTLDNFKANYDGVSYFNKKPSVTLNFKDNTGVDKVTYLDQEGKEVTVDNPNGKTIDLDVEKGLPKDFIAYDIIGNKSEPLSLSQLTGVALEGKAVVYDDKPTVKIVNNTESTKATTAKTKEIDGKTFLLDKNVDVTFQVSDKNVVSKFFMYEGDNVLNSKEEPTKTVEDFNVKKELTESAVLDFKVSAENIVGNKEKDSMKLYYDMDAPQLNGVVTADSVTDMVSGMYSSKPVTVNIKAEDLGVAPSGVDKVLILDEEKSVVKELSYSDSLTYTLDKSGQYYLQVIDKVGNKSEQVALNTVLNGGMKSNNFQLVQSNPLIESNFDKPVTFVDMKGNIWFSSIPTITTKVEDDAPFRILKISQNDKLVFDKDYTQDSKGTNKENIKSDIKNEDVPSNGQITYNTHLEDVLGETLDNKKEFFIDTKAPNVTGTDKDGFYKENALGVFVSDKLTLNFKTDEELSGLKKVEVLDLSDAVIDEKEGSGSEIAYTIKKSGIFKFRFTDNVGNISKVYTMSDLGFKSDKVYQSESVPTIESKIDKPQAELEGKKWYNSLPKVDFTLKDDVGVAKYEVIVNGVVVDTVDIQDLQTKVDYSLDLSKVDKPQDGHYNIKVVSKNFVDKEASFEDTIYVDDTKPEFSSLTVVGSYKVFDEGFYSQDKLRLDFNLKDFENSSGVSHISIFNKDKTLLKDVSVEDFKASYTLESSGQYFVQVVDNLGNKSDIKALNEILPSLGSNNFVLDGYAPTIWSELPTPQYVDGDKRWYNKTFPIIVQADDNSAIAEFKVIVNGKEVVNRNFQGSIVKQDTIELDVNQATRNQDGSYNVEIIVVDKTGMESRKNFIFYVDDVAPSVTSSALLGSYNVEPEGTYSKQPLQVNLNLTDVGYSSGVAKVHVFDGNKNLIESVGVNEDRFSYVLNNRGGYYFQIEDKLGNKSAMYSATDLFPFLKANNFVVDNANPTGDINTSNPQHSKNGEDWFKENQNVDFSIGDETALKQVVVTVNGSEVINKSYEGVVGSDKLSINTGNSTRNPDGSYNIVMKIIDKAGNEITKTKTIYVDDTKPVIKGFIFTDSGYKEGESITVDESSYGFYFKNGVGVQVNVEDANASSGLKELTFRLHNVNGNVSEQVVPIQNGVAYANIPENFKGQVKAVATDNVGNKSDQAKPSGVITENANWHVNSSNLTLTLPPTDYKTADGQPLYNKDVNVAFNLADSTSGFRNVNWGIDGKVVGNTDISNGGGMTGYGFDITNRDSNLITGLKSVGVVSENRNNIKVNLASTDRVGHASSNEVAFSIDKDAPVLSLSYDSEDGDNSYFNHNRTATLTIKERNFRASDVQFSGNVPKGNISWNSNGDVHTATIHFTDEMEYDWGVSYTDLAGNKGNDVQSQKFTIDKSAPQLNVSYSSNDPHNGNFYNNSRMATVTVNDKNFDPSRVNFEGQGTLSSWSSNGDIHTANITYAEDGEYQFKVSARDKAGNQAQPFESGQFIIDTQKPELVIAGVNNGASYKGKVLPIIEFKDKYLDEEKVKVTLKGNKKGNIELGGSIKDGRLILNDLPKDESYDDIYTLDAHVSDKAGNISEQNVKFVVNRFGSNFDLDDIDFTGKYLQRVKEDMVIQEVSKTELDISKLQIIVSHNGTPKTLTANVDFTVDHKVDEFGYHHYKYIINKRLFEREGSYSILAISQDLHGDKNDTRQTELKFIVDRTPPRVVVIGADEGQTYKTDKLKVELDIKDNIKLDKYQVYIDSKEVKPYMEGEKIFVDIKGSDKPQDLEVIAYDKAQNKRNTEVRGILITTNWWLNLKGNKYFQGSMWAGLGALLVGFIFLLRRYIVGKKREQDEQDANSVRLAQMHSEELANSKQPTGQATGQAEKEVASTKDKE
ncbi:Ig-like domain repeat protein [Bacillus cereus]|uniref:Ig-like domain repeat protein n=1 Tax=Bacillus cereus TaxID=1396 RepID=UPI003D176382